MWTWTHAGGYRLSHAVEVGSYNVRNPMFQEDCMRAVQLREYFGIAVDIVDVEVMAGNV